MRTVAFVICMAFLAALILTMIPAPVQGQCYTPSATVYRQRSYNYNYSYDYVAPVVVEKVIKKVVVEAAPVLAIVPTPAYFAAYYPSAAVVAPPAAPLLVPPAYGPPAAPAPSYAHPSPPAMPYAAPGAPCANGNSSSEMSQVLSILQGFDGRLKALESRIGLPTTPTKPDPFAPREPLPAPKDVKAPNGMAVIQAKCAACHDAKVSAKEGNGLSLLDGPNLAKLEPKEALRVVTTCYKGSMPKQKFADGRPANIPPLTDDEVGAIVKLFDR